MELTKIGTCSPYREFGDQIIYDRETDRIQIPHLGIDGIAFCYSGASGNIFMISSEGNKYYMIERFFSNRNTQYNVYKLDEELVRSTVDSVLQWQYAMKWLEGKEKLRKIINQRKKIFHNTNYCYDCYDQDA